MYKHYKYQDLVLSMHREIFVKFAAKKRSSENKKTVF